MQKENRFGAIITSYAQYEGYFYFKGSPSTESACMNQDWVIGLLQDVTAKCLFL